MLDKDVQASWRWWTSLAALTFVLNLVWENAHGGLYDHVIPGVRYLRAAGGDVVLVGVGVAVAWPARRFGNRAHLLAAVGTLTALAVIVELAALSEGRWDYTAAMPTAGPVGLSPLLQLPATGVAAWWAATRWLTQLDSTTERTTTADEDTADQHVAGLR